MTTKKNILLWALYDFANSVIMIVFFLYFAQIIVIDRGISDLAFNLTFTISTIFLVFSIPITGFLLDKYARRITGLRYTTVLTAISYGLCTWAILLNKNILSLILFTIATYFYQFSFTFYTPLLNDIAKPSKRGFVSGLGVAANHLGQIFGLLIVLPFSNGKISLFNASPRIETLLPAVIIFFVLTLPMLLFFKEPKRISKKQKLILNIKDSIKESKALFSVSGVLLFIISYFLFNDAIITASNNFSIFLEQVWHISDNIKTFILLGILASSAIGGLVSGVIADKLGHKRTLLFILYSWVLILPLIGFMNNFVLFVILTALMGLWFGATWTVSRSVMAYISPSGKHNLAFAYFGLAERASTFIGPIVWGVTISKFVDLGSFRYRLAVLAITVFIIIGIIFLHKVRDDRKEEKVTKK